MFLILSGHPELELAALDTLPQLPRGTSLAALREAAKHFNVDTEIRRYPTEQIASVPLPAIGHFKAGPNAYHFSVIHKVDSRNVYLIDGTTAKQLSIRRSRFGNTWTGIAMSRKETLVLARGRARWVVALLACMFVADLAIYRSFVCRLERRRADAQKASSERKPDGGPTGIKSAIDISHQPLL